MSSIENLAVLWPNFSPNGAPILYYPYLIPTYNQLATIPRMHHDPAPAYIPSITQESVHTTWKPKRQSKSPRAPHRIATPPYTPPGSRPGPTSERRLEMLQRRSDDILKELQMVDKRLQDMESMIKRRLYDIVLRQYTRKY